MTSYPFTGLLLEYRDVRGFLFGDPAHPVRDAKRAAAAPSTYFKTIFSEAPETETDRQRPEDQLELMAGTSTARSGSL